MGYSWLHFKSHGETTPGLSGFTAGTRLSPSLRARDGILTAKGKF